MQGKALGRSSRIGRTAIGIEAADIGYANRTGIVAPGMGADLTDWTAGMDRAIEPDNIMISDTIEAAAAVPGVDISDRDVPAGGSCGAMHHDKVNLSHDFLR